MQHAVHSVQQRNRVATAVKEHSQRWQIATQAGVRKPAPNAVVTKRTQRYAPRIRFNANSANGIQSWCSVCGGGGAERVYQRAQRRCPCSTLLLHQ